MKKESINLTEGDCFYYAPNLAFAVLISSRKDKNGDIWWTHALRSPTKRNQPKNVIFSKRENIEKNFINGILDGSLEYYPVSKNEAR